ncbi:MAG: GreA/GreB family elongation factor [Halobacteriovoraceae bacterium]|nr:GreA/GreB family elongation factor [Halobacteriovoraceae bacterium]MCB9095373.1 GreA/GreB family elongation factor [Halobacteriovoraceae bacterium]
MNLKQRIKSTLIEQVKRRLEYVEAAAESARTLSTDGDLKSDGKYDTRGIEAGYLAGAQIKRVEELKKEIELLESIQLDLPAQSVSVGSLVDLELNGKVKKHFISSSAGGTLLNIDGTAILVISAFSPIGQAAINLVVGDEFEVETASESRIYKIVGIE